MKLLQAHVLVFREVCSFIFLKKPYLKLLPKRIKKECQLLIQTLHIFIFGSLQRKFDLDFIKSVGRFLKTLSFFFGESLLDDVCNTIFALEFQ